MNGISEHERRRAFAIWMRTGRWPAARTGPVERKFNPYHDPRNGQFTFAPGGPRSLGRVIVSDRWLRRRQEARLAASATEQVQASEIAKPTQAWLSDAVYRPDQMTAEVRPAQFRPASRGSNSRAFFDPMTLEQSFPGLANAPAGALLAAADNLFDLGGPARGLTTQLTRETSNVLISQIRAVDPTYRFESLGFPTTFAGQINQINELRFVRAAAFVRKVGELRPMQVETLRFMQKIADSSYEEALTELGAGKLRINLSDQEALGNYIDRSVRLALRERYRRSGLDSISGLIRVNRREEMRSGDELTFRRPDARVGSIAFDVTLTAKTLKTPQIRGFFNADFKPIQVIIIRPRQLGPDSSYIITRPEYK